MNIDALKKLCEFDTSEYSQILDRGGFQNTGGICSEDAEILLEHINGLTPLLAQLCRVVEAAQEVVDFECEDPMGKLQSALAELEKLVQG